MEAITGNTVAKAKDILAVSAELSNETSELDKVVERMESRLAPVMSQSQMKHGVQIAQESSLSSPLSTQIQNETSTVRALRLRLEDLLDSIEL